MEIFTLFEGRELQKQEEESLEILRPFDVNFITQKKKTLIQLPKQKILTSRTLVNTTTRLLSVLTLRGDYLCHMFTYFNPTYRGDIIYLWMFKVLKVGFVLSDHTKRRSAVHAHRDRR